MVAEDFRPVERNSLRGFARIRFQSGLVINDCAIHVSENGRAWASPPSRQLVDRNGVVMKDAAGKVRWQPVIEFANNKVKNSWSSQVVEAVRAKHPEALPGDAQ